MMNNADFWASVRSIIADGFTPEGYANVIASLLAGAEVGSDSQDSSALSDYERECQCGAKQEGAIEKCAESQGNTKFL